MGNVHQIAIAMLYYERVYHGISKGQVVSLISPWYPHDILHFFVISISENVNQ